MGLNDRPLIDPRWYEWVRGPSRGFENVTVEIIDPNTTAKVAYNPTTGQGGSSVPIVVWPVIEGYGEQLFGSGPYGGGRYEQVANAWVEITGRSSQTNSPPQPTEITQVHVHIDLESFGSTEGIRAGFQVRVLDGARDKILEHRIITIDKVTTGGMAAQRTLECRINEKAYI